jgi:hypothetical protein
MKRILYFLLFIGLTSCYYDNEEELYPNSACQLNEVTYSKDIQPIIKKSCAIPACHVNGGTGNGNFESYAGLKAKVDNGSIEARVLIQKNMPPDRELSRCEIDKLKKWLAAGALNN